MSEKAILTTFEAADICNVSYNTIKNWVKRGLLSAYRTAGGHLRIKTDELKKFSREYNIPLYDRKDSTRRRILIVDEKDGLGPLFEDSFKHLGETVDIFSTSNPFEAGMFAESTRPDLIVLNEHLHMVNCADLCSHIRKSASLKSSKLAVVMNSGGCCSGKDGGPKADVILSKPVDKESLQKFIEPIIVAKRGVRGHRQKKRTS